MFSKANVVLIIPAYNEENTIAATLAQVQSRFSQLAIVVVDDGSKDRTAVIARKSGVIVLSLPCNLGYGAALQTGYKFAMQQGYDYCLQMDADGQHEPACLPALLQKLESGDGDVVIGSRFLADQQYPMPLSRKIGKAIFAVIASLVLGQKITDPTSGFQGLSGRAIELLSKDFPVDYPDTDVLIMLHRSKLRIAEISVPMYPSISHKSMHSGLLHPFYYLFKMMMSIMVTLLRRY